MIGFRCAYYVDTSHVIGTLYVTYFTYSEWQGRNGLKGEHSTMEASTLPPHQCHFGCSLWGGGRRWLGPSLPKEWMHRRTMFSVGKTGYVTITVVGTIRTGYVTIAVVGNKGPRNKAWIESPEPQLKGPRNKARIESP